jgi:DNA helicase-2/ATP-dependent DNA helicase PcrA
LTVIYSNQERTPEVRTATAYLEALNPEQRRAVEHGPAGGLAAPPAGHRRSWVRKDQHPRPSGRPPGRSGRRPAPDPADDVFKACRVRDDQAVERIARKVLGDNAGIMTDALTWAGTYHSIGARLLRETPNRSAWT